GARVNKTDIEADLVIATCGAWMNTLFEPLDIHFSVYPQKAQIIHLTLPHTDTHHWPVVMPPSNQYMLTLHDCIIVGATHERTASFNNRVTASGVNKIFTHVLKIAPRLSECTYIETRVGFRPHTRGSIPIVVCLPNYEAVLLAYGLRTSCLTTGPFVRTLHSNL